MMDFEYLFARLWAAVVAVFFGAFVLSLANTAHARVFPECNPAAERLSGLSREQWLGHPVRQAGLRIFSSDGAPVQPPAAVLPIPLDSATPACYTPRLAPGPRVLGRARRLGSRPRGEIKSVEGSPSPHHGSPARALALTRG